MKCLVFFLITLGLAMAFSVEPLEKLIVRSGSNGVQVGLDTHNRYRSIHNAPMMRLTPELNNAAQRYADKLARESKLNHDQNRQGQGENLALQCVYGSDADLVKKSVNTWYKEVCDYNFKNPGYSIGTTSHFTQVVWKESTQLGIGFARGESHGLANCLFVVARYKKAGNLLGHFDENVSQGSFRLSDCGAL